MFFLGVIIIIVSFFALNIPANCFDVVSLFLFCFLLQPFRRLIAVDVTKDVSNHFTSPFICYFSLADQVTQVNITAVCVVITC